MVEAMLYAREKKNIDLEKFEWEDDTQRVRLFLRQKKTLTFFLGDKKMQFLSLQWKVNPPPIW